MIENEIIYWILLISVIMTIIGGFTKIFFPNWLVNRYMTGKSKPARVNIERATGFITIGLFGYVILWLLGYVS